MAKLQELETVRDRAYYALIGAQREMDKSKARKVVEHYLRSRESYEAADAAYRQEKEARENYLNGN